MRIRSVVGGRLPVVGRAHCSTSGSRKGNALTVTAWLIVRPRRIVGDLLRSRMFWFGLGLSLLCALLTTVQAHAQSVAGGGVALPKFEVGVGTAKSPKDVAITLQILFMMTILSVAPSILIMMTAFTRLIIVFSILRSAMGTPQIPPNQVLIGLALFLTCFIMQPVFGKINDEALQPYFANKIPIAEALDKTERP